MKLGRGRLLINIILGNFREGISGHSKKGIGMRSFVRGISGSLFQPCLEDLLPLFKFV